MKRLKFLLFFVFMLVGTLTVLAFTSEKYQKSAVIWTCYKYNIIDDLYPIYESDILNSSNWTYTGSTPSPSCFNGPLLCGICFDSTETTAAEARQILWDHYDLFGDFPLHGSYAFTYTGKKVAVYRTQVE